MNVCILGSGLTSLTLAKSLINQGILVDIHRERWSTGTYTERDAFIVGILIHKEKVDIGIDIGVVHNDMDGF